MGTIAVRSGRIVDPFNLRLEDIDIDDIAHSLSNQCRFAGHSRFFYCVAEHCCHCYDIAKISGYYSDECLMVLLHDATEAYLVDLPRPIKNELPQYREIENKLSEVIMNKFFPEKEPTLYFKESLKTIDNRMLITEQSQLFTYRDDKEWIEAWNLSEYKPYKSIKIKGWSSRKAKIQFLRRFNEVYK